MTGVLPCSKDAIASKNAHYGFALADENRVRDHLWTCTGAHAAGRHTVARKHSWESRFSPFFRYLPRRPGPRESTIRKLVANYNTKTTPNPEVHHDKLKSEGKGTFDLNQNAVRLLLYSSILH